MDFVLRAVVPSGEDLLGSWGAGWEPRREATAVAQATADGGTTSMEQRVVQEEGWVETYWAGNR